MMEVDGETTAPAVKFNKRKRAYRPRLGAAENIREHGQVPSHDQTATQEQPTSPGRAIEADSEDMTMDPAGTPHTAPPLLELLRRRKQQSRPRRLGLEFSHAASTNPVTHASSSRPPNAPETDISLQPQPENDANSAALAQARFAPQTGTITDANNRHMMSYIDTEMAKLRQGPAHSSSAATTGYDGNQDTSASLSSLPQRQPAALGQIQEIDLGPEATSKNIAMTEMATRRLVNGDPSSAELAADPKRRRPRKRRGSDDLKRDQVVEAFLHENKLDLYDDGHDDPHGPAPQDEAEDAADDLIAEQFQRDFLDAVNSRNRLMRTRKRTTTSQKTGQQEEKARGPKLGGSRSARAAMHAAGKVKSGPPKR